MAGVDVRGKFGFPDYCFGCVPRVRAAISRAVDHLVCGVHGVASSRRSFARFGLADDEEEAYDTEPLPIIGRCRALYPFEGERADKIR